ncbi:hypothetical protein LJR231_003465 [Phyllobacterium sp. LjRoot231]|uniref:hypothetical protein n=1 Tax=Phyllobacterium sp. LjRoot231 TaxID=3342289 RepID=UPI003ECDBEAF
MSDVYEGDWRLFSHDPVTGTKKWYLDMGTHYVIRSDTPVDELLDLNAEKLNDSTGKRFGDGQVVGSIPMDIYQSQLAEASKNGDQAYIRRWLNDSDHQKFRTFRGRL